MNEAAEMEAPEAEEHEVFFFFFFCRSLSSL